ncbi:MAG: hypothetical protein CUN57_03085, partial [Phototrophicales bacterium]
GRNNAGSNVSVSTDPTSRDTDNDGRNEGSFYYAVDFGDDGLLNDSGTNPPATGYSPATDLTNPGIVGVGYTSPQGWTIREDIDNNMLVDDNTADGIADAESFHATSDNLINALDVDSDNDGL